MPRIDDFVNALNIARTKLLSLDPEIVSRNAEAELISEKSQFKIVLPFFLRKILITFPHGEVEYIDGSDKLSLQEQGLVLHYLLGVSGKKPSGNMITFREIPAGEFYYQPFLKRAQIPLLRCFGNNYDIFYRAGKILGGSSSNLGDAAMVFRTFPKVPVTLILWKGDDEFPPDGNILFDSTIGDILSGEDVAFLAGTVVYKLIAISNNSF